MKKFKYARVMLSLTSLAATCAFAQNVPAGQPTDSIPTLKTVPAPAQSDARIFGLAAQPQPAPQTKPSAVSVTPLPAPPAPKAPKPKPMRKKVVIEPDFGAVPVTVAPKVRAHRQAVIYPGLGVIGRTEGDDALVVRATGDKTEIVNVSSLFQNRISTPFETPRVIDSSDTEYKISGSNIFLQVKNNNPVVVYITGSNRSDPVLSLTLMPKEMQAQTVILQLEQSMVKAPHAPKDDFKPATYEERLRGIMRTVASGEAPEGFTEEHVRNVVGRKGSVSVQPLARYSNAYLDVYTYRVQNQSGARLNLAESDFYQKGVRAVGMYPLSSLDANAMTYVFVISDKSALDKVQH